MKRYPGVSPFTTEQQSIFFGRENDIRNLTNLISLRKQVLLYSKSGVGKTSLLNAGVLPKLQDKFTIIKVRFFAYDQSENQSPIKSIIDALIYSIPDFENLPYSIIDELIEHSEVQKTLWFYFKKVELSLKNKFILVFDQFEELFSYPPELIKSFKQQFYELTIVDVPDNIMELIGNKPKIEEHIQIDDLYKPLSVKSVFAIRSDRLSLLNSLSDKIQDIQKVFYELIPLDEEQTKHAIISPAKSENNNDFDTLPFDFSNDAVNNIVAALTDNGKQNIETTQLQIVCQQIENIAQKKQQALLTDEPILIEVDDLPKFKDIFLNFYEEIVTKTDEPGKTRMFIENQLIRDSRRISLDAIICKDFVQADTLKHLVNKHLLRSEKNTTGGYNYELSHDTLIEPILSAKSSREREEQIKLLEYEQQRKIEAIKEAEQQQRLKDTQESLFTAKRIINFFTPKVEAIATQLKGLLIFDRPKNIINGDFYFLKQIEDVLYIGVFDATGSGVPGAFLRVMGYSLLDKIISDNSLPVNEILNIFREKITEMFMVSQDHATDGFDGALCAIDLKIRQLTFSGAMLPLYFVDNDTVKTLKGTRLTLGYNPMVTDRDVFSLNQIEIGTDHFFYLSTDGYINQLKYGTRKKFLRNQFKDLLLNIHQEPINEQMKYLSENLTNLKKSTTQTDDILIIGFKL